MKHNKLILKYHGGPFYCFFFYFCTIALFIHLWQTLRWKIVFRRFFIHVDCSHFFRAKEEKNMAVLAANIVCGNKNIPLCWMLACCAFFFSTPECMQNWNATFLLFELFLFELFSTPWKITILNLIDGCGVGSNTLRTKLHKNSNNSFEIHFLWPTGILSIISINHASLGNRPASIRSVWRAVCVSESGNFTSGGMEGKKSWK